MTAIRTLASWLLTIAACALAVAAIAATWMDRQVMDSDHWTRTSVQVLRDGEVQELTAEFLADQLVAQQATADTVRSALPPALQGLSGTATAALGQVAERAALDALRARALEDLWAEASRTTHAQFVRWLDGKDVRRTGDVVTLDLQPVVERLARRVGFSEAVIAAASEASGGAEIRLVKAGQYEQTRTDAHRLERAASLTLPLAVVIALIAIAIAPNRRRAVIGVGLAAAVAGIAVIVAAPELQGRLVDGLVEGGAARPVAREILEATVPNLVRMGWLTVVGGAVVAILAFATRPSRPKPGSDPRPMPRDRPRRASRPITPRAP